PDAVLEYLARVIARQRVPEHNGLGILEGRNAARGQEVRQRRNVRGGSRFRYHHRHGPFPGTRVRDADDGDLVHVWMGEQEVLHFLGSDVLALADDDVLAAPGDHQTSIDELTQVASTVETFRVERRLLVLGMQVTKQHLRPTYHHLS